MIMNTDLEQVYFKTIGHTIHMYFMPFWVSAKLHIYTQCSAIHM